MMLNMQIRERMHGVRFSSQVIRHGYDKWGEVVSRGKVVSKGKKSKFEPDVMQLSVTQGSTDLHFDNEQEWFVEADREQSESYKFYAFLSSFLLSVEFDGFLEETTVVVQAPSRADAVEMLSVFSVQKASSMLPPRPRPDPEPISPLVFIGHGGSGDWRKIKDHIQDKHNYRVTAYEVGARAGHTIRDVLDEMLTQSSLALLVMTGEDATGDGQARARQNVVHEAGLFQGRLGFHRAIAVVEEGVEVFSNLDGVQQLRYAKGAVETTFGDILAILRREFGDAR